MVYVVERYLPGLSRSDLLHELFEARAHTGAAERGRGVRYLGSTIVSGDVLRPDRARSHRHTEGRITMSVSASIPATVQIRRGHLVGLIGGVAALATCVTWVVTAVAFDTGTSGAVSSSQAASARVAATQQAPATFTMTRKQIEALSTMAQQSGRAADPVMSMTPAQLAGVGLGTGYQLPNAQRSPTAAAVLASMSPETRRYTEAVMNLTFEQLAAGAAGQP